MALSNTTKRSQYTAAGETTFVYGFVILDEGDIEVITTDTLGVSTTHTLGADYSVTGVGAASGGTVVFSVAPTAGHTVTLRRAMSLTQPVDLVTQGGFSADVVEEALDRLTMIGQQLEELLDRTLRTPPGDANAYTEFPSEVDRASKYLAFDGDGKPIASGGGPGSAEVPVTSFASTLLDDSDAASVLTTLGVTAAAQTLLDDASVAAMRATLGVVVPNDCRVVAYLTADQTLGDAVLTDVGAGAATFTEVADTATAFDADTGVFTAPASGVYLVAWRATLVVNAGNHTEGFYCHLTNSAGTILARAGGFNMGNSAVNPVAGGTAVLDLTASDTVKMRAYHATGVTRDLLAGQDATAINIVRIA